MTREEAYRLAMRACEETWNEKTCKQIKEALEQEPKTGHWIDNHNGTISCSYCHTWFYKDDRYSYMRYCPSCDAKMVEP